MYRLIHIINSLLHSIKKFTNDENHCHRGLFAIAPELAYALSHDEHRFIDDWWLTAAAQYTHSDHVDTTFENIHAIHSRGFQVNVYIVNDIRIVKYLVRRLLAQKVPAMTI